MLPPNQSHPASLSEEKIIPFQRALTRWFRKEGRDLPWRHTKDPYAILVSEIMLQQTQVATVIDYYNRWLARFPTVQALAEASEEEVLGYWQGLGYYSRARNLHAAAKRVVEAFDGCFPTSEEQIRSLPGVGRYTAAAVSTFAFNLPTPPVDGNIARVMARLLDFREPIDTTAGLEYLWETATLWQPKKEAGFYNEAMMELGALVCLPRNPACESCPVEAFCQSEAPETLPVKKPRRKTELLTERCGWVKDASGKILLEQQVGNRWKGLWRLPLLGENASLSEERRLATTVYPFTHHRITLEVYAATLLEEGSRRWFAKGDLDSLPMPSPHRRVLNQLLQEE